MSYMPAITASLDHPGYYLWQLMSDNRQNDDGYEHGGELTEVPVVPCLLDNVF
jgi:hypothetical protein